MNAMIIWHDDYYQGEAFAKDDEGDGEDDDENENNIAVNLR